MKDFEGDNTAHPSYPFFKNGVSPSLESSGVVGGIVHDAEKHGRELLPEDDFLGRCLGRKIKDAEQPGNGRMMKHRSLSCDAVIAAGQFDAEGYGVFPEIRSKGRQWWQHVTAMEQTRSGVAFVLDPREGDPPAPTKIFSFAKGRGLSNPLQDGYSSDSARIAEHFNQEQFRYADHRRVRGRSQPPPFRDPDMAGSPTGHVGNHNHNAQNPITSAGKENLNTSSGAMGCFTPRHSHRTNVGNDSGLVGTVINHEIMDQTFVAERNWRLQVEPDFAARCEINPAIAQNTNRLAKDIKVYAGHTSSQELKENLQWPGA